MPCQCVHFFSFLSFISFIRGVCRHWDNYNTRTGQLIICLSIATGLKRHPTSEMGNFSLLRIQCFMWIVITHPGPYQCSLTAVKIGAGMIVGPISIILLPLSPCSCGQIIIWAKTMYILMSYIIVCRCVVSIVFVPSFRTTEQTLFRYNGIALDTGGSRSWHYDSRRYHQWQQSKHQNDSWFSMLVQSISKHFHLYYKQSSDWLMIWCQLFIKAWDKPLSNINYSDAAEQ